VQGTHVQFKTLVSVLGNPAIHMPPPSLAAVLSSNTLSRRVMASRLENASPPPCPATPPHCQCNSPRFSNNDTAR